MGTFFFNCNTNWNFSELVQKNLLKLKKNNKTCWIEKNDKNNSMKNQF